jgi:hypothetical protein
MYRSNFAVAASLLGGVCAVACAAIPRGTDRSSSNRTAWTWFRVLTGGLLDGCLRSTDDRSQRIFARTEPILNDLRRDSNWELGGDGPGKEMVNETWKVGNEPPRAPGREFTAKDAKTAK